MLTPDVVPFGLEAADHVASFFCFFVSLFFFPSFFVALFFFRCRGRQKLYCGHFLGRLCFGVPSAWPCCGARVELHSVREATGLALLRG